MASKKSNPVNPGPKTKKMVYLHALLEFDSGEFHDFQCRRSESGRRDRHAQGMRALEWLVEHGLIELIGEEYFLTEYGKDVRDTALHAAAKYVSDWEGQ